MKVSPMTSFNKIVMLEKFGDQIGSRTTAKNKSLLV
jgi:hypothetical protein